jgi:hypothetical protein
MNTDCPYGYAVYPQDKNMECSKRFECLTAGEPKCIDCPSGETIPNILGRRRI